MVMINSRFLCFGTRIIFDEKPHDQYFWFSEIYFLYYSWPKKSLNLKLGKKYLKWDCGIMFLASVSSRLVSLFP